MNMLQKWAMMATVAAAGFGVAAPALAEVSEYDIALIAQACIAIDRGDVTEEDLTVLDDEEYGALMAACGFALDGSVTEAEMVEFESYYVVFQQDVSTFETVIYDTSIEVETESSEELDEVEMDEAAMNEAEFEEAEFEEAELDMEEAEFEEAELDMEEAEFEEADETEADMDESAMDEAETEEG